MKNRKYVSITLILFIIMNVIFSVSIVHFYNFSILNDKEEDERSVSNNPKLANGPPLDSLPYWAINRSTENIYRLLESINITINTFTFPTANYTHMQIFFTNGSIQNYNMDVGGVNEYYYDYRPEYNAPLGFQNVSFLIYDITDALLNAHTTYTNFTIRTNYMVVTNSSEYYIEDDLYVELSVNDFGSYQFEWNVTIVDSTIEASQNTIFNLENNLVQFTFRISNETFNDYVGQIFYIKVNITNKTVGEISAAYFPFKVLNSGPNIDESSISFSPSTIFRGEECEVTLNVTDIEDPSQDLDVSMTIEDAEGVLAVSATLDYNTDNNFSKLFSISGSRPKGNFKVTINAEDQDGGITSFLRFITIKNNLPEIHSYLINGKSMNESISILYGNNIIFSKFNVTDVEGVAYIKVALIDENKIWYNVSKSYIGYDETQISIRTIELITGVWYVYIYVVDSDGVTTSLIDDYNLGPQSITIIPDALSGFLPWASFIIGTILGILVGVGLAYRRYKSKIVGTQAITQKKKPSIKKLQKEEITKKITDKKSEEIIPEKEVEKKEVTPKRKIKRKL